MLVKLLIGLFFILNFYQIILAYFNTNYIEGMGQIIGPVIKEVNKKIYNPVNTYLVNAKYYIDVDGYSVDNYYKENV